MKVRIVGIRGAGELGNERFVLRAAADIDIGNFLILQAYASDGKPTAAVDETFWFPDKDISKGDLIVVYTKRGKNNEKHNKSGNVSHFFYWGMGECLWTSNEYVAVIAEISDWNFRNP